MNETPLRTNYEPTIVRFDGVRNLDNGIVRFVIAHDLLSWFIFATQQSPIVQVSLAAHGQVVGQSIIIIAGNTIYTRLHAELTALAWLERFAWLCWVGLLLRSAHDSIHDLISKSRLRILGKVRSS